MLFKCSEDVRDLFGHSGNLQQNRLVFPIFCQRNGRPHLVCRILNCVILSDRRSKRGPNKLSKINRKPATNAAFIACARPQAIGPLDFILFVRGGVLCDFYVVLGIIAGNFIY